MAQKEDRASALLIMLTRLGGKFIDNWIKAQISLYLPSFNNDHFVGTPEEEIVSRALMALPAIPWLRGLAKAVRGEQVGSVLQNIAAKFKLICSRFRDKKRDGSLRSLSSARSFSNWDPERPSGELSLSRGLSEATTDEERDKIRQKKHHLHTKAEDLRSRRRSR